MGTDIALVCDSVRTRFDEDADMTMNVILSVINAYTHLVISMFYSTAVRCLTIS